MGPETVAGTGRMELAPGPYRNGAETLLHGEFGIYPSKGTRYALSLTCTELHIQCLVPKPETDQRTVVALADVVGCHTLRSRVTTDCAAYFTVYAYPLKKRKVAMGSGRARQRTARTFQVDGADDYNKNQAVAEKWAVAIKCLVLGVPVSSETGKRCVCCSCCCFFLELKRTQVFWLPGISSLPEIMQCLLLTKKGWKWSKTCLFSN